MKQEDWLPHLTEIRTRLLIVAVWFVASLGAGLWLSPRILLLLKARPEALGIKWNVFSMTDGLFVYMKCGLLVALLLTLPLLLYHLWAFVRPGLSESEARRTLPFIPAAAAMFAAGAAFCYFVVFPMMLRFLIAMNRSIGAAETYGIDRYFSFLFGVVLPMAVAFELPLVVLFLTRIGLLTPQRLRSSRKYAYLGLAIVGSCISPPEMVSHLAVTIPLIALFELSVYIAGRQWRLMQAEKAGVT